MNLLAETKLSLAEHGYTMDDVAWVGCEAFKIPIEAFLEVADTEYHNSYGGQEVACDLIVALKDGSWLERAEYDGSEWWEYKRTNKEPSCTYTGKVALTTSQVDGVYSWSPLADFCDAAERGE